MAGGEEGAQRSIVCLMRIYGLHVPCDQPLLGTLAKNET
jgi:hypothetical protein